MRGKKKSVRDSSQDEEEEEEENMSIINNLWNSFLYIYIYLYPGEVKFSPKFSHRFIFKDKTQK